MPNPAAPDASSPDASAGAAARPSRVRRIVPVVLLVVVVAGVLAWLYFRTRISTSDAQIQAYLEPISTRVPGTVVGIYVNDNQEVKAGQVLFRLDDRPYRAALEQAQANLQAAQAAEVAAAGGVPITAASSSGTLSGAQAALGSARAGANLARQQLAAARAQLTAARARTAEEQAVARNALSTRNRYAALVAKQEVSRLQYDQIATQAAATAAAARAAAAQAAAAQQQVGSAAAAVQVASGRVAEAQAAVQAARTAPQQMAVSRAQAVLATARVAQAKAALDAAQLNLDYTTITAPSAGRVGNKTVELGQSLSPGQTVLVVVPNEYWVIANYKETDLADMHPGQRASIGVDAYGTTLRATVNSIGSGTGSIFSLLPPENATGNYVKVVQRVPVKILFEPGQDMSRLRPGLSVEVTVFK